MDDYAIQTAASLTSFFPICQQPSMTQTRKDTVEAAFKKLDKTGDGVVTVEDLKGIYSAKNHPKVVKGEATEEQLLKKFLSMFESNSSVDGKVITHLSLPAQAS